MNVFTFSPDATFEDVTQAYGEALLHLEQALYESLPEEMTVLEEGRENVLVATLLGVYLLCLRQLFIFYTTEQQDQILDTLRKEVQEDSERRDAVAAAIKRWAH